MKFPQLPIGAQFRFQGEIYCKTSPLAATGTDGTQRMIPRSAQVEALQDDGNATATPTASPLRQAANRYHDECRKMLHVAATEGPTALEALERHLAQAHAKLIAAID